MIFGGGDEAVAAADGVAFGKGALLISGSAETIAAIHFGRVVAESHFLTALADSAIEAASAADVGYFIATGGDGFPTMP